jgi:hypothetical protein
MAERLSAAKLFPLLGTAVLMVCNAMAMPERSRFARHDGWLMDVWLWLRARQVADTISHQP